MNNLPFGLDGSMPGFPKLPSQSTMKDPFELVAGPFVSHELRVVSFHGEERVNDTFAYDVTFATDVPPEVLYPAVDGEPACLTIKAPGHEPRIIQGIVAAFEPLGHIGTRYESEMLAYNLTIVPRLWLLRNQRRNRAFQDRTPRQIIEEVLADSGIRPTDCNWRIRPTDYAPLPFVLQREETDYDFFCRVLADAGIFFYFEHASGTLDTAIAGAGGLASAIAGAAQQVGGAPGRAMGVLGKAAKMLTMLNFGDEPGHVVAVAPMTAVNQAAGQAVKEILDPIKGPFPPASFWDAEPCDTIEVDDGHGAHTDDERIYRFGLRKEIRPKSARLLEWDVKASQPWEAAAETKPVDVTVKPKIGISMGPGGPHVKANADLGLDVDSPAIKQDYLREDLYQLDTLLRAYPKPELRAKRELERLRRDYLVGRGQSDCRRLGAGYRFRVGSHPVKGLNIEYTVTEVVSDGVHPDFANEAHPVYRNAFTCIPAKFAPRPPRPEKRPKLGLEIATVVDLGGETYTAHLNTNETAYVHVRFKWDIYDDPRIRDGIGFTRRMDSISHTAIRVPVLQSWAGNGYGCQFIPREGMDVLIGFLGGQGERPVVLGCLYSQRNLHPSYEDIIKHQRVGIVTKTRPTNGNWSEFTIDDHQGQEVIKMRAAKDLEEEILHNRRAHVGNDDTLVVEGDRSVSVGGTASEHVGHNKSVSVFGSCSETTGKSHLVSVGAELKTVVTGNRVDQVRGNWKAEGSSLSTSLTGDYELVTRGAYHRVTGTPGDEASDDTIVYGSHSVVATENIQLQAMKSFVITVGSSRFEMRPDGITLSAKAFQLQADSVAIQGKNAAIAASDTVELRAGKVRHISSGASIQLDSDAKIDGGNVKLQSGKANASDPSKAKDPNLLAFTMTLVSHFGTPIANAIYHLDYSGEHYEGVTDGNGRIEQLLRPTNESRVLLRVWHGDYPESIPEEHVIRWWAALPPIQSDLGTLIRLRNLGYIKGPLPEDDPDAMAILKKEALMRFMRMEMEIKEPRLPEQENDALACLLRVHKNH